MPRYHFNVFDGAVFMDRVGSDLPDAQAAQIEAIQTAAEIIRDHAKRLALGEDWHMEVTDEAGLILFRLDFHVTAAPAMRPARVL